jgi:hypothetical protein
MRIICLRLIESDIPGNPHPTSNRVIAAITLISRAALTDHHTVDTPMELGVHLKPTDGAPLTDPTRYRQLVGSLVYLGITRPDITHSVHILSQFVSAPT